MTSKEQQTVPVALGYAPPSARRGAWLHLVIWSAIGCLVLLMVMPAFNRSSDRHPPELRCRSHLRQIGMGVVMYANENGGAFPPDFETILLTQEIEPEVFVCAETNDTPAAGPTTQAVAAQLSAGGHLSYVYTGKGLTSKSPTDAVVAYEPFTNHRHGFNVLYADGSVHRVSLEEGRKVLAELAAGHNPPRAERLKGPVTGPTSAPSTRAGEFESR